MLDDWCVKFPGCEPVAHRLRATFLDRWVRFHSLPDSKRYPDDQDEYATVLGRQNRILDELVGGEAGIILLTTEYSGPPGTVEISPVPELQSIARGEKPWRTVPMHEVDENFDESTYWHVFASELAWRPGVLDPVLRLVIDNVIANVMIVDRGCRWIFHPYDGGMDLILENSAARDGLRSTHADWLSPWPDGM